MLTNIYNQKITLLNKLDRSNSATGLDIWFKTVLTDGAWYKEVERAVANSKVSMGTYYKVLIPYHDEYKPYDEWKNLTDKQNYYTMSSGDYVVLGEVGDDVTASNIVKVLAKYGENVCQVKYHKETHNRFGSTVQLKIEGV